MRGRTEAKRPDYLLSGNRYELLVPVDYREDGQLRTLTELQLRRLTGADKLIMESQDPPQEKLLRVTEAITGLPRVVLLKLDYVEWDRLDEIYGYFAKPGSVTGATS